MNTETMNRIPLQEIISKFGYSQELSKSMKCLFHENHKHGDKSKSAGYKIEKNTYYCQVCLEEGKGLNPINFVMREKGCSVSEALQWGDEHFGNKKKDDGIYFIIPKEGNKESINKPNNKIYQALMNKGIDFQDDYRGIRKEIFNSLGIRKGFNGFSPKVIKLLQPMKDCGVMTLDKNEKDYFILKGYDVYIPYYLNGEIVNIQGGNHYNPEWAKYCFLSGIERILFNIDILKDIKEGEELWVVEGVYDCLTLINMGMKAVGLPGVNSYRKYKDSFKGFKVKSILDNDDSGNTLGNEMIESGVEVYKWKTKDYKDINDFIQRNQGVGIMELMEQVESYKGDKDNASQSIVESFFIKDLTKFYENSKKVKMGDIFGLRLNSYPLLEKGLDGVQEGLWMIPGGTNIGKTGFLVNLTLDLIKSNEGVKVLFFQVDGATSEIYGRMMALLGETTIEETYKTTNNNDREARKMFSYNALKEWGKDNRLDVIDTDTIDSIDKLKEYIKNNKSDKMVIVIDGVNYLDTGKKDGLESDKYISTILKNLSSKYHCPVIVTCEVRKLVDTKNINQDKLAKREMTVEDIKGSTSLGYKANLITSVSLVNDDDFEKDIAEFQVQINKNKMIGGRKGRLLMRFNKPYSKLDEVKWISYEEKKDMNGNDKNKNKKTEKDKKEKKELDTFFDSEIDNDRLEELRLKEGIK